VSRRQKKQTLNSISKPTATRDLKELTYQLEILKNPGLGTGSQYELDN
jgi:hypothetical protein